ncbi:MULTISPECIES: 2'-5' RNA ligase family protein [unclassified Nocardioides]|uniref:2'-5' RNA ligase family protein n=1 Tax=unclassified Nocardioides TaxID=2615069 RepID=UPI0024072637|nr:MULTISPECIES: 2'-5' RNA ligase family protein [unclassified Nocardioides]
MRASLDLLLDDAGESAVRAEWGVLTAAGLPSAGDRRDATHAPHVTVAERDAVRPAADEALEALVARLPVAVHLGAPVVLGARRGLVVARSVVPTADLLALHAAAHATLGPGGPPWSEPGRWLPHVTVSGRLDASQVGAVVAALGPGYDVVGARLRRWSPATRTVRDLGPHRS